MTTTPTTQNRGLLPLGTYLPEHGGHIVSTSLTAYEVLTDPAGDVSRWISFDAVHGRPTPATPLLSLG